MSVRCITQVFDKSAHAGTDLLMLIVLADYSDDEGNSYPAVASLARKCRMKQRNANYILKALQESGELRVLKNEGPRGTNRYRIMLASLGAKAMQPSAPLQRTAPLQHSAPAPATQCVKPLHPIADEPSFNHQEPSPSKQLKRETPDLAVFLKAFETFYAAYPRKVGRKDAIKEFQTAKATSILQTLLDDIHRRLSSGDWKRSEVKFIPHPATYIRKRRWEDEDGNAIPEAKKPWDGAR